MNRRRFFLVTTSMAVGVGFVQTAAADDGPDLVVVANRDAGLHTVSPMELRRIFLTKMTRLSSGKAAEPANLPLGGAERIWFDRSVLQMTPEQVRLYWIDRKVRGGAPPPEPIASPPLVLRHVARHEGGIAYVKASDADDSVRVVARIRDGKVVSS